MRWVRRGGTFAIDEIVMGEMQRRCGILVQGLEGMILELFGQAISPVMEYISNQKLNQ